MGGLEVTWALAVFFCKKCGQLKRMTRRGYFFCPREEKTACNRPCCCRISRWRCRTPKTKRVAGARQDRLESTTCSYLLAPRLGGCGHPDPAHCGGRGSPASTATQRAVPAVSFCEWRGVPGTSGSRRRWQGLGASGSWELGTLATGRRPAWDAQLGRINERESQSRMSSVLAVETGRIYSGLKQAARNLRKRKAIAGQGDDRGKDQKPKRQEPRRVRDLCCSGLWPDASSPKTPKPQAEGRRLRRAWCGRVGVWACGCVVRGRGRILCVSCADRGLAAPRKGGTLSPTCHP